MQEDLNNGISVFEEDPHVYDKKTQSIPKPAINIGLDTKDVVDKIIDSSPDDAINSTIDLSALTSFNQVATNRNQLYNVLDLMAQDSIIAAMLETYAEDATETNDEGKIMWAKSKDPKIEKYVNFLLKSLQVDKHAYA